MASSEISAYSPYIDCNEIENGLYLGDIHSAKSTQFCEERGITHVLTAFYYRVPISENISTMFICIDDCDEENILQHFESAYEFIKAGQENSACLVHCFAGLSRSATLVIAYFMKKYSISKDVAMHKVKRRRYHIMPNDGFLRQLDLYEAMQCSIKPDNIHYKLFRLYDISKLFVKASESDDKAVKSYTEECAIKCDSDVNYKCKSCREYLFCDRNVFPHFAELSLRWYNFNMYKDQVLPLCTTTIFVEVLPWMTDAFKNFCGKIFCPKCQAKLGSFQWASFSCSCGCSVNPSFCITPSKVDKEVKQGDDLKAVCTNQSQNQTSQEGCCSSPF